MVGMRSSVSSHALQLRPAWKCSLAWPRRVPDSASWKSSEVIFFFLGKYIFVKSGMFHRNLPVLRTF